MKLTADSTRIAQPGNLDKRYHVLLRDTPVDSYDDISVAAQEAELVLSKYSHGPPVNVVDTEKYDEVVYTAKGAPE